MGLAASQARLLTITSRKSSAQFESMRLSHQKLALSRGLADVSNEYQNALKQTRLYYDFYGNGSTDNMLNYGLFMTPSFINDYTPVLITNRQNRVVLSSNFARAAEAAGIPKEGLDGLIDQDTRNAFIQILTGLGEIDPATSAVIQDTIYNPNVGLGYNTGLYMTYETEGLGKFENGLKKVTLSDYQGLSSADLAAYETTVLGGSSAVSAYFVNTNAADAQHANDNDFQRLGGTTAYQFAFTDTSNYIAADSFGVSSQNWDDLTLYDILYGTNGDVILTQEVQRGYDVTQMLPDQYDDMLNTITTVIDLLAQELEDAYSLDFDVQAAVTSAYSAMNAACWYNTDLPELATTTPDSHGYLLDYDSSQIFNPLDNVETHIDNLDLMTLPAYSYCYHGSGEQEFLSSEDISAGGYSSYEPANYWVSLPSTISGGNKMYYPIYGSTSVTNFVNNDGHIYYYGAQSNYAYDYYNTAIRNAVVYALDGANNNLALINLYDMSGSSQEGSSCHKGGNYGAINLSKFVQAWYTYFIQALANSKLQDATGDEKQLLESLLSGGSNELSINFHQQNSNSRFATEVSDIGNIQLNCGEVVVDDGISDIATFYDTIINQICEYGWVENNQVKEDSAYLQEMLKSGKMFLFKMANDNYYYQKNYSTDTFIKEIADESAIAQAEAKYKTEKARINAKEEEIDIKMKNLDTEISALETEYEAVKKMISTHAKNAFTRYQS